VNTIARMISLRMNLSVRIHMLKTLLALAAPFSIGRILHVLITIIGMMMVARQGVDQFAAGTLALSSFLVIQTSTITIFYAIGLYIRHLGDKKSELQIGLLIKNAVLLALLFSIPGSIILSQMDKFLLILGQDPKLVSLTKNYFLYSALGIFPSLIITIVAQFYIGIGKTFFPLLVELINLPLNLFFAYGLVLGNYGWPSLGLGGIGLAAALSQYLIMIVILLTIYLCRLHEAYGFFKKPFSLNKNICNSLLKLGLPMGIQFGGELSAIAMSSYLMGYMGVDALAALQLTQQCSILIIMLTFGLSQGLSLLVSGLYGQPQTRLNDYQQCIGTALWLFVFYMVPVVIIFSTLSIPFANWYLGNQHLDPYFAFLIHAFFLFSAGFILIDGLKNLLSGILRGLQDTKAPSRINLLALWGFALPLAWFFGFILEKGPIGLRAGFICGVFAGVLWLIFYLVQKFKTLGHEL
jgi:MATE family multidrug resistance protein